MTDSPESLSRREMIGVTAAALAAPLLNVAAERARSVAGRSDRFLTPEQFALLDELTELIIPADDHSPGARAAEVARYIDCRLAESPEPDWQAPWRSGLEPAGGPCRELHGKSCLDADPAP